MIKNIKRLLICLAVVLVIFSAGAWFGYCKFFLNREAQVSGVTILRALNDRGFLVTQSNISNQSVEIAKNQSSFLDKLLWQQVIRAEAITEVNLGIDLKKLTENDVQISARKITIKIPAVEIFDARVLGDINLENKQGILKKIFENESGYNEAQAEIIKQAEASAQTEDNMSGANQKAQEEIKRIVGYMVSGKDFEVVVEMK